ncbi:MAG: hypothetical protein QM741_09770 [Rudaea sp.]|uniref:hypothetical protein n=1 Tax=Rudaea sp. TaxID=2136325 RepID=UPI0039E31FAA
MKTATTIRFTASLLSLAVGAAFAGGPRTTSTNPAVDTQALARAEAKFAHALQIVDQFKAQATAEGITGDTWRFEMVANLMKGSEANFASVSLARSYTDAMSASIAVAHAGNAASAPSNDSAAAADSSASSVAAGLGSATTDLVYVPISPCRIVDTRVGGAPVPAGTVKSYFFYASNVGNGSCSVTGQIPGTTAAAAFAANVTVAESGITGIPVGSYLQIYPQGGSTTTSFINFGPGEVIANAGVISLNQANGEFSVVSNAPTQVIVDTFGVFIAPQPTALECTTVDGTTVSLSANGGVSYIQAGTCPSGYTQTATYCVSDFLLSSNVYTLNVLSASCLMKNLDPSNAHNAVASARCCRVPGR